MSEPTRLTRRSILTGSLAAALGIPVLAACDGQSGSSTSSSTSGAGASSTTGATGSASGGTTDTSSGSTTGSTASNDGVLTIGASVGTSNVFPQNFNVFGGGDSAPGNALFWETLFRITSKNGMALAPNLAEKVVYTQGGKVATYTMKDGITWNDGQTFTSKDVAFTYGFIFGPPGKSTDANFVWLSKAIATPDTKTAVVTYNEPQYTEDLPLSLYFPIYPQHIYSKVDHSKYQDKSPVGTGPGKLTRFASQQIEIAIRDDYWGGKGNGVKTVKIVPAGTAGNIESQITQGKVDWAEGGAPGVETNFVKMDSKNGYYYYADGSTRGIILATHKLPCSDVAVRKALRGSVDMSIPAQASGVGYTVPSMTGLDPVIYQSMLLSDYADSMKPDVDGAKKTLSDAGWTIQNGNLAKDGKEYPLSLNIQNDNAVEMATMPIVVDQWKKNLGLTVKFTPLPADTFGPAQAKGNYDMSLWTTNAAGGIFNAYTMYMQTKIYKIGDDKADGNYGRFKLPDAANKALMDLLSIPSDQTDQIKQRAQVIEQAIVDGAPYIPVQNNGAGGMFTTKKWSGLGKPEDIDYFPRVGGYNNMIRTVLDMKPAG